MTPGGMKSPIGLKFVTLKDLFVTICDKSLVFCDTPNFPSFHPLKFSLKSRRGSWEGRREMFGNQLFGPKVMFFMFLDL